MKCRALRKVTFAGVDYMAGEIIPDDVIPEEAVGRLLKNSYINIIPDWDDIPDKPFGETEEVCVEFNTSDSSPNYPFEAFEVGQIYTIVFDGVEYPKLTVNDGWRPFIGSPEDSLTEDLPFHIYYNRDVLGYRLLDEDSLHTVVIKRETVKTLDSKYLPSGGGAFFVELNYEDNTVITPYEEITKAINDGMLIMCRFDDSIFYLNNFVIADDGEFVGGEFISIRANVSTVCNLNMDYEGYWVTANYNCEMTVGR